MAVPSCVQEMERRGVPGAMVDEVLHGPRQVTQERDGLLAYRSRTLFPDGRKFLIRCIVDEAADRKTVITVYRTSGIEKYRRPK